jgi:hypothetical protein
MCMATYSLAGLGALKLTHLFWEIKQNDEDV